MNKVSQNHKFTLVDLLLFIGVLAESILYYDTIEGAHTFDVPRCLMLFAFRIAVFMGIYYFVLRNVLWKKILVPELLFIGKALNVEKIFSPTNHWSEHVKPVEAVPDIET